MCVRLGAARLQRGKIIGPNGTGVFIYRVIILSQISKPLMLNDLSACLICFDGFDPVSQVPSADANCCAQRRKYFSEKIILRGLFTTVSFKEFGRTYGNRMASLCIHTHVWRASLGRHVLLLCLFCMCIQYARRIMYRVDFRDNYL